MVAGLILPTIALAGLVGRNNSVGGISISSDGILGPASKTATKAMLAELRKNVKAAPEKLSTPVPLRMVSLRGLAEAIETANRENSGRLPEEVQYLAGLQRIQYILVYPEENDVVLAGPGEGWTVDERANVVGISTGRPVLLLDDLLVALRYATEARTEGISCSIDPTEEGNRRLAQILDQQRQQSRLNPPALEAAIKQAYGPQQISITGVPQTSHFARVLVAADYRMKRLAMKIDESPVRGLPSYLDLIKGSRIPSNVNPRWWMACNYEPLAASEDGLAWELRGPGVQVMTEDEFIEEDGDVSGTGRRGAAAQRWADMMTEKYDALSARDSVFGELRNIMDMCVVAALLEKEGLLVKAGLSVPILTDQASPHKLEDWYAPQKVAPEVSFLRARNSWIVTASGGVQVESWQAASRVEQVAEVNEVRRQAAKGAGRGLWWQ
jgi:hypothetical protein